MRIRVYKELNGAILVRFDGELRVAPMSAMWTDAIADLVKAGARRCWSYEDVSEEELRNLLLIVDEEV